MAIHLVAVNAVLVATRRDLTLITYKNNLLPRLFYWPFVLGLLLVLTLIVLFL